MKELLYQYNPWWEGEYKNKTIERPRYISRLLKERETRDIIFITGLRRVGKTTLMHQLIGKLLREYEAEKIFYISLDHPLFTEKNIIDLLKEYRIIHGLGRGERIHLFFDEIHMKKGFERELKVLYDMENVKIYASGSSSLVLKHQGSFLTGRYKRFLVEPLNFQEFLRFRGVKVRESERYLLEKYVEDYLRTGGIPEYVLRGDDEYLRELVEGIIYKDIVGGYGIKNPGAIKKLFVLMAERVGSRVTYNKLAKILGLSVDTVKQYLYYLEETYLIYLVPKYSKSLNERIYSPKKAYLADNGVRKAFLGYKDVGALVENQVFLKIKDRGETTYYHKSGREIDFIINDTAIEVKYKDEITEKDLKPLKGVKTKNRILVSKNTESMNDVDIIPLTKFLFT